MTGARHLVALLVLAGCAANPPARNQEVRELLFKSYGAPVAEVARELEALGFQCVPDTVNWAPGRLNYSCSRRQLNVEFAGTADDGTLVGYKTYESY